MHRWVGYWLMICFALPILLALMYVCVYQRLLDTPDYYPFWLAESYFYLGLPAVALLTWKIHWGKKHPVQYLTITVMMLIGILYLGTKEVQDHLGDVTTAQVHPLGLVEKQLIAKEGTYEIPYFPVSQEGLVKAIKEGENLDVTLVSDQGIILSFADKSYASYTLLDRLLDQALGILAVGVFSVFFYVVMSVWWRELYIDNNELRIQRWWKVKQIPFSDIILIRLDSFEEEIQVETEETVYNFPYDTERAKMLAQAADEIGLDSIRNGTQWIRAAQYREVRLEENQVILDGHQPINLPYECIAALYWDPVVQITLLDDSRYTITDVRYTDRAWFEELARKVRNVWEKDGLEYSMEVEPKGGALALTLHEWLH
ncbi:hypothetical protein [Melghirimyces algeriensis]|uniref:Uncharacterized protein n=1 Tax=Melghirimyces algeriensis TaxID=910412 RepID=A0A521E3A1_9BACL|nr:hypothetical protein [Melghirimyces algeriensis]SMO77600.1 hypothetical protein SAMN06264849_107105 [Melghirimyces algeriensis]